MNKKIKIIENYGGAKKSALQMTEKEFDKAVKNGMERIRYRAFSHGLPIYYGKKGKIIAEYADGRKEVINS